MKKITRPRIEFFLEQHKTDSRVLDIGSGGSSYSSFFPNRLAFDVDPKRKPDIIGDAHELPFDDESFSIILCTEVLEHLSDPQKAIAEMWRVLQPGGKVILTTRFLFPLHDVPGDYFRYTRFGLQNLFKDWRIEVLEEESKSFEAIAVLLQRMVFQAKYKANRLVKGFLVVCIKIFLFFDRFTKVEFGDIKQETEQGTIMSSGYYLVAVKNKI